MSTKLGTLTLDLVARVSSFTQGMNQASTSAEREMRRVENSVVSASGAIKSLAATAAASFSVAQISNYADEFINLQNRLKLVTGSTQELAQATKDTYAIAQATAGSWDSTVQVYQRFAQNAKELGINLSQVASLTDTVSKAIAISGGTAASSEAALVQFGQALSSGVLRGEEFNSIAEQAGGLRDAIARGLNLSAGDLKKWAADGKLTTDIVIKALQESKVSVDDLFNKTDFTGAQGFKKLSTATTLYIGDLSKSTGASKAMYESLSYLSENLEKVTGVAAVGAAYLAGTYIPVIYGTVAAGYAKTKQLIDQTAIQYGAINAERAAAASSAIQAEAQLLNTQTTLAALAAEKALELQRLKAQITDQGRMASTTRMAQLRQIEVQVTAELTVAETTLAAARTRSTAAAVAGMGVGRGLLGLMTGPVGLGLAVAGVAASYLMLRDSTKDTTSTLDLQKGTVSELVAEYSKLDDLQKRTTMRELEKQVKDLSTAYTVSFSDLNAFIGWLEDSGSVSESTAKKVNGLYKEYRTGGINASEFATAINGLSGVQVKHKQKIDDLTTAQAKSKTEYEKVKTAQDALTKQTGSAIKANKDEAESINAKRIAQEKLNALNTKSILEQDKNNLWIRNATASKGAWGTQWSDFVEQFKQSNSLPLDKTLEAGQLKTAQEQFIVEQKRKNLSSQISNDAKNQTKELEKQQQIIQVNAKVQANAAKYNFNGIEGKYGLPSGLLSAVHMQESRGNANAVGPQTKYGTAKGGFQFLDSTAKRFKLFGNDVFDLEKSADAAGQYLQLLYKKFGDWDKAISAYHAGEGNVAAGTNIGPVNRQYVKNIKGYVAGVNGYSGSFKDFDSSMDDQAKYAQKTLEEIDQLNAKYSNADITRNRDRLTEIAEAERLGQTQLIDQINLRYSDESYLAKLQLDQQVNGWKWVGEERINKEAEINRAVTNASKGLSKDQKQLVMNGINALSKYEIDEYRKTQQLKIAEYQMAFSQPLTELQAEVLNMQAKASMGGGYGAWALQNQYKSDFGSLGGEYDKNVNSINEDKTITDDVTRKQLLLQAEESFRQSKLALNEKYTLLENDLAKSQHESQMGIWQSLLSQTATIFNDMAAMVKETAGESSAAYKTLFFTNQSIAMAQAMINTEVAATKAMAEGGFVMGIPMATAIRGLGYASVGMIAAQTITGMAHDGIDNVPKEGTWLLDKGERVVDSRTNADLKNYLKGPSSGNVEVNVQVTDSGVTSQSNQTDQKQLGQLIGNAVRAVIMQEKRQGGLLSK